MALLEAVELTKVFRHQWTMRPIRAIEDVSLQVHEGEVLGLIGPNGAGKTTTIKLLLALLRPTRGRVTFNGMSVHRPRARQAMGFLPEQPYFYDYLTVEETLHFYGQLCGLSAGDRRSRISELVDRLQLGPFLQRTVRQLSKGNLQRVGVAQAIIHRPSVAILDEPMSGLDPIGRKEMRELIAGLRTEGTAVVFSSHILPDAEALCDRVAVLVGGHLREVVDVSSDRQTDGPFDLTASGIPPATVGVLRRLALAHSDADGQWSFRLRDRAALREAVKQVVAANGFVEALAPERPTLEDRFLAYMRDGTPAV
jgi:ABC-2 type transport system ATP-binding protein